MTEFGAGTLYLLKGGAGRGRASRSSAEITLLGRNLLVLLPQALCSSAWILAQLGDANEASNRIREAELLLTGPTTSGHIGQRGWTFHSLGRACLLLGRIDQARSLGRHAVELSSSRPGFAAYALNLLGDVAAAPDQVRCRNGSGLYREALALAAPRGMRPLVAHCHLGLGKLHLQISKSEQGREYLAIAMTMYREMDVSFWRDKAEAGMRKPI